MSARQGLSTRAFLIGMFALIVALENVADGLEGDGFAWVVAALFAVNVVGWWLTAWWERS